MYDVILAWAVCIVTPILTTLCLKDMAVFRMRLFLISIDLEAYVELPNHTTLLLGSGWLWCFTTEQYVSYVMNTWRKK